MGEDVPLAVNPPGEDITVYSIPLFADGLKRTDASALPPVAITPVGGCGGLTSVSVSVIISSQHGAFTRGLVIGVEQHTAAFALVAITPSADSCNICPPFCVLTVLL
jgi:hypothetical protein